MFLWWVLVRFVFIPPICCCPPSGAEQPGSSDSSSLWALYHWLISSSQARAAQQQQCRRIIQVSAVCVGITSMDDYGVHLQWGQRGKWWTKLPRAWWCIRLPHLSQGEVLFVYWHCLPWTRLSLSVCKIMCEHKIRDLDSRIICINIAYD